MNRKTINDTKTIHFSEIDDGYVVVSPLYQGIVGFGETEAEALRVFANHFQKTYADYIVGGGVKTQLIGWQRYSSWRKGKRAA
jgi:hypothetical protein